MPQTGFWASNVSIQSLDRAKDLVRGSLKALHIAGTADEKELECTQPILGGGDSGEAIPQLGWTRMVVLAGVATTVGSSIPVGYNIGVMNTPAHILRQFCNTSISTSYQHDLSVTQLDILWSTIVSIFLVGGVTGSLSGGWIADRYGRKGAIYINNALGLVAAVLFLTCRHAGSVEMMLLARLIVGFAGGLVTSTVPMYLTEIAAVNNRGAMGVLCPLGLTVGVLLGQLMGLKNILGTEATWHYLLSAYALLIIASAVALPFLPESPKYLYIVRGHEDRAIKELSRLRSLPVSELSAELSDLRADHKAEQETGGTFSIASVARSRALRLPLLLVCALQAGQQCSGINAVFYYSMTIFENAGLSKQSSQYATLGAGGVNLAVAILAIYLVNQYGRRSLLLLSCISAACCLIALTVTISYIKAVWWMPYVCILSVLSYVFCYAIGLGPIPYFIGSELFQVGPRPVAMAYGSMANWGGNFLVGMTFPSLQTLIGEYCFLIFAATTLALAAFVWFYLPESKGRSPQEMAELLKYGFKSKIHSVLPVNEPRNPGDIPAMEFTDTGSVIIHHHHLVTRPKSVVRENVATRDPPKRPDALPNLVVESSLSISNTA